MPEGPSPSHPEFSTLERQGALIRQLIHDLTNHITVVAGNAQVSMDLAEGNEALAHALQAIGKSCALANELLTRHERYLHQLTNDAAPCPVSEVAEAIRKSNPNPERWPVTMAGTLPDHVAVQPRWLAFAVWQLVQETRAQCGDVQLLEAKPAAPLLRPPMDSAKAKSFQIQVRWKGREPMLAETEVHKPKNLSLAMIFGLVRWLKGTHLYRFTPPDQNCCFLSIPVQETPPRP